MSDDLTPHQRKAQKLEEDRDKIRELDPIAFLGSVMAGYAIAEYEPLRAREKKPRVKKYSTPSLSARIRAGEALLRRITPELSSVSLDANVDNTTTFSINLPEGFGLPNSQPRDVTPEPDAIDHHEAGLDPVETEQVYEQSGRSIWGDDDD